MSLLGGASSHAEAPGPGQSNGGIREGVMTRISELLLNFALNAGWQIVVIFIIASIGSLLLAKRCRQFPARLMAGRSEC